MIEGFHLPQRQISLPKQLQVQASASQKRDSDTGVFM